MAITGSTSFSYHPTVNQGAVETAALHDGFHVVRVWQRSRGFSILVWQRGKGLATATVAPPATQVVQPSSGTEVKGNTYLAAAASERTFAVTGLEFVVRGAGQTKTIRAWQVGYGWLGAFGSEGLPDGSYTVQSVATAADGGVGKSRPVLFRIAN
jgi:hypothetical protein